MHNFYCKIVLFFIIVFGGCNSFSYAKKSGASHTFQPKKSAIVIDYTNNRKVLYSISPDEKRHPASLTKVMTIYLLFDALRSGKINFNTKFKVSRLASIQMPSKLGLKVGNKIRVLDVIRSLLVKSANDMAVVAAEGLCGDIESFVNLMNMKARQLGMKNTHFENPSGVPNSKQITSARDIAILFMSVYNHFPQYWHLFSERSFCYNNVKHPTHCKILNWYKGADGAKTGYICASGYNLGVSAVKYNRSGQRKRLFVVVMGGVSGKSRDTYAASLLDKYFEDYNMGIVPKKSSIEEENIKYSTKEKKGLMNEIDKSETTMIMKNKEKDVRSSDDEKILQEEEEIDVNQILKNSSVDKQFFERLYEHDDESVVLEEEIIVNPKKHAIHKKKMNRKKTRKIR